MSDRVTSPIQLVRPEPKRNQWGQYLIPDPVTGEERSWVRATTWAGTVADNFALEAWKVRMTAMGLAKREDLYAQVASISSPDTKEGKKKLDKICEDAQEHAGSRSRANIGTALHSFTQQLDMGGDPRPPKPFDKDLLAYREGMKAFGIEVSPRYVERIVTVDVHSDRVAGTLDRLGRVGSWQGIVDVKSGADLTYSWTEIAIQLALYAHAKTIWDIEANRHWLPPAIDRERAIVIHLPAGKASFTPYWLNIREGWRMALICGLVRDYRKRKDLATSFEAALATGEVA